MKKSGKLAFLTKRNILIGCGLILAVGALLFVLEKKGIINVYSGKSGNNDDDANTTSTAPTAQSDFTGGNEREAGNSLNENEGTGGITDNNGAIGSGTDTSNPLVSATGEITLYSPKPNASISSGHEVSGTSTLPAVSYRLIDSVSGVIATGELNVVNGKFSGTLNFTTGASEGRLDIFGASADGNEFSTIEVPLRFN